MRIAVIGGTGVVGHHTVEALGRAGHDIVVVARSHGVNVATGEGLDDALVGVEAVVNVTNIQAPDAEATQNLFRCCHEEPFQRAAEQKVRVRHHVLLSIVGVDRIEGNAHYAGKRLQEKLLSSGPVPYTIQRGYPVPRVRCHGGRRDATGAKSPPCRRCSCSRSQLGDVADVLAEIAVEGPARAGPPILLDREPQDPGRHGSAHAGRSG